MELNQLSDYIDQWLTDWQIDRTKPLLLAVSGGVDSMVLLASCMTLQERGRLKLQVMHINHQLRPDAAKDQQLVMDYCEAHDLDLTVRIWRHESELDNVEARARDFRYGNFAAYLKEQDLSYVVIAHHQQDVAETTLMRLIQGASVSATAGIKPVSPLYLAPKKTVLRPLLNFSKEDLYDCAEHSRIPYREDETNQSLDYTRNRMRHYWFPKLAGENPNVIQHFAQFAGELNGLLSFAEAGLNRAVETILDEGEASWTIDLEQWKVHSPQERPLLLRHLLRKIDATSFESFGTRGIQALSTFLAGETAQGSWQLPHGYQVVKLYERALIQVGEPILPSHEENELPVLGTTLLPGGGRLERRVALTPAPNSYWLPASIQNQVLSIRRRQPGDYLQLQTGDHQKLRRYFINEKFPADLRERALLLAAGEWVLAVIDPETYAVYYYYPLPQYEGAYWQITHENG
ncbi:MAG: tRNA lysidine(34) synthetase TilS [Aerococcus sp.]|nr:tRNA lysidine(34) synthetase TilS [Aerococcus sp.]